MRITSTENEYIASNNLPKNKLNYLIVMPRFTTDIDTAYMFPLGIAYVSSSLKYAGYNIFTLNPNHYAEPLQSLMYKYINKFSINVVMTGGLSPHYHMISNISDIAKNFDEKIIVVVGGGIITSNPFIAMQALSSVDIGVIGEGEVTAIELCKALDNNSNLLEVDGLIIKNSNIFLSNNIKKNNNLYKTKKRKEVSNIDDLRWPDYQGFEFEKTLEKNLGLVGFNDKRTITMLSSRSCPYKCTFCFHTCGNIFRQRTLENFFEELDYLINKL